MKRWIAVLLLAAVLLTAGSVCAAAEGESFFYLSAQVTKTEQRVLIAPVKIPYAADDTIAQALLRSSYHFEGLDERYSRFITAIEGQEGNFTYCGDFPENVNLLEPASSIQYLAFSEDTNAQMTPALQQLMQTMADYLDQPSDVQEAAKSAYDEALAAYPGNTEAETAALAEKLKAAIQAYEDSLTGIMCSVSVQAAEGTVTATNAYGRVFEADGFVLSVPQGVYTICLQEGNRLASCEREITGDTSISLTLPTGNWFDEAAVKVSSTYESANEGGSRFADGLFHTTADSARHEITAEVPDAFSGQIYPYIPKAAAAATEALTLSVQYLSVDGTKIVRDFVAGSQTTSLSGAVGQGTQGNELTFRLSRQMQTYIQSMELKLRLARVPTLASLQVKNDAGTLQASDQPFSPMTTAYTYKIVSTAYVTVCPAATMPDSTVTVNGQTPGDDGGVTVPINKETAVTVLVAGGGYTTEYTLTIQPGAGKTVKFSMLPEISLTVVNKNGEELAYTTKKEYGNTIYTYTLVPGEEYAYVATLDTYYHTKKSFVLPLDAQTTTTYSVSVLKSDWLAELALGHGTATKEKGTLTLSESFASTKHSYTAYVSDATNAVYAWVTHLTKYTCTAVYPCHSFSRGETPLCEMQLTNRQQTGTQLTQALLSGSAYENTVTFRISAYDAENDVTNYSDYMVTLKRTLSLKNLTTWMNGSPVTLTRSDGETTGYSDAETSYCVLVPAAASALDLAFETQSGAPKYGDTDTGYEIHVNGSLVPETGRLSVPLRGDETEETITVVLTNRYAPTAKQSYTIRVQKAATTPVHFAVAPQDALVYVYESVSGNRVWPESNTFALSEGFTYLCTITKAGYVGQQGTMELRTTDGKTTLVLGEREFTDLDSVDISLQQAAPDKLNHRLDAQWADFRGTAYQNGTMTGGKNSNNAVTSAPTPISAEEGTLYWAAKLGDGYSEGAVSNPILVDGCLIVYAGNRIFRVNKDTGEVLKTGTMAGTSDFAINGPTYADGVLLVGLSSGRVQAFDAVTLESLWIYTDPLRGQANCPITVSNGYAYTGFWNAEKRDGSFVCLSITDEDPTRADEEKVASWRLVKNGGFYWAGAYAGNDFILVGTDDGADANACLYLLRPQDGAVLDAKEGLDGDLRSTICYDEKTDAYYFTSKGGSFYRATVGRSADGWSITALDAIELTNGSDSAQTPPMSTSTPVVYNGRAYIGVSGTAQFSAYSGHNITVIDLTAWKIAYAVPTQGYPQTSGLLTTAYEADNGYVYVYFFDNYTPGTMRVLRDSAGQTTTSYVTVESNKGRSYDTAYALFTPTGDQAQYAICSPIADENGTIYFKNDSGRLMAFGSALKGMTLKTEPKKTQYNPGESFDPDGMAVEGEFVNGVKRDVTAMLALPAGSIQAGDKTVSAAFGGNQVMYHNQPYGQDKMRAGVVTQYAPLEIPITVQESAQTGTIGNLAWSYAAASGKLTVTGAFQEGQMLLAVCYDANGRMTHAQALRNADVLALQQSSGAIRLFLLDADSRAICAAELVKGTES